MTRRKRHREKKISKQYYGNNKNGCKKWIGIDTEDYLRNKNIKKRLSKKVVLEQVWRRQTNNKRNA